MCAPPVAFRILADQVEAWDQAVHAQGRGGPRAGEGSLLTWPDSETCHGNRAATRSSRLSTPPCFSWFVSPFREVD
jgi:hypothetical protein